ncbi:MAG: helix-turn-helix domain-containing protein [Tepidisphaeraceae bacterium]
MKKYRVTLEAGERQSLHGLLAKGKADVRRLKHAQVLLAADESPGGPAQGDVAIAVALGIGRVTVERVRRRFVEEGMERALSPYRLPQSRRYPKRLDGEAEARLIAIACSAPPDGQARWTLSLLAGRLVELRHVTSVSRETVRKTLKKTR